ncbi:hypothetical protein N657DRAFT_637842 [Parathielavia appendiculata]|uniref:Uncharacterized protein n=1 Tax=Parathielavia appendiculata TaxID=2587402 RepID=A0AAN6TQC3_9PEZI|nr:hypothetical protein N657DRAFT_637842 [Parathielavia appendiculata]
MVTIGRPSSETTLQQLALLRYEPSQDVGADDGREQVVYGVDGSQQTGSEKFHALAYHLTRSHQSPEDNNTASPENMGTSHQISHQDSEFRGKFIPLFKSFKEQSTPPPRRQEPRIVYLPLSLTDSQMDRLASVLSSESDNEPRPRGRARIDDQKADTMSKTGEDHPAPRMRSRSPAKTYQSTIAPLARSRSPAHAHMAAPRVGKQPAVIVHNPSERTPSPVRQPSQYPMVDDSSFYYLRDSAGERCPSRIGPLHIHRDNEPKHLSILQEYIDQRSSVRDSDRALLELNHQGTQDEASSGAELAYTPLAPFLSKDVPSIEGNQDNCSQRKSRESDKSRPPSRQLAISLSPGEQSLLYCELEFILTTAINDYITAKFAAGRFEADWLKEVVGFRYDMETQFDLVRMHVNDFKFYLRVAASTAILGVIDTAKANARVLRVRTFCQPDTVIAKQLLAAQGLFNILGCPEDQQIKLAEIIAFFKAVIERQRIQALQGQQ